MLDQTILKNPLLMKSANLIDGEWIAAGADAIPVINPATGVVLGTVPNSGRGRDAGAPIEAAARRLPGLAGQDRGGAGRRVCAACTPSSSSNQDDLAKLLTLEQGKPLAEAQGRGRHERRLCAVVRRGGAAHLRRRHPLALGRPAHPRHQGAGRRRRRDHARGTSRPR